MQSVNFLSCYIRSPSTPRDPCPGSGAFKTSTEEKRKSWRGGGTSGDGGGGGDKRKGGSQKGRAEGKGRRHVGEAGEDGGLNESRRLHAAEEPVGGDLTKNRRSARRSDLTVVL